ncbi:MAG: tRNA pseudouridine(38-40) synthase TruA [Candidatus Acidiferrales bacterium]
MRNLKLTLAYDGSEFHGWAIQPDRPTIQGTLVETLGKLTGEKIRLYGCGRTDAGVHALGQVAHFKTRSVIPPENLQRALNSLLPASIRVNAVEEVPLDFHARWHARGKTYRYRILRTAVCPPFLRHFVYHYPYALDAAAMERAAPLFEGEHDFSTFGTWDPHEAENNRIRTIFSSRVEPASLSSDPVGAGLEPGWKAAISSGALAPEAGSSELIYTVRGRSFLRYMVRKLVGTLLEVGKGRLAPEDIPRLFEARDRALAGPTVPPEGLYLVEVDYAADLAPASASTAQPDADSV